MNINISKKYIYEDVFLLCDLCVADISYRYINVCGMDVLSIFVPIKAKLWMYLGRYFLCFLLESNVFFVLYVRLDFELYSAV